MTVQHCRMLNAISKVNKMLDRCLIPGGKRHCSYLFRIKQLCCLVSFKKAFLLKMGWNKEQNQWLICYQLNFTVRFPVFCFQENTMLSGNNTYLFAEGHRNKKYTEKGKAWRRLPWISEEQVRASSEPSTFNNGWRTGNIREVREE